MKQSIAGGSRSFYKPELDILRFCAFGLVFALHLMSRIQPQPTRATALVEAACEQGVQIFFLLSAYLITHLLLVEHERTGRVDVRAFYIRRILRIWPVYFSLILLAALLTAWHLVPGFSPSALGYFVFLSGNWYVVLHGWLKSPVGNLWTISVEEQFYLIWPVTLLVLGRRGLALVTAVVVLLSYVSLLLLGDQHAHDVAVRANSFVQFQFFAVGAGLALLMQRRTFRPGPTLRVSLLMASAALTLYAVGRMGVLTQDVLGASRLMGGYLALAVSSTLFFLFFLDAQVPRWAQPFTYLGRISYGLYAFHLIAIDASARVVAYVLPASTRGFVPDSIFALTSLTLTVGIAYLSYRYFESPFLRLKGRFTTVASRDNLHLSAEGSRGRVNPLLLEPATASAGPSTQS